MNQNSDNKSWRNWLPNGPKRKREVRLEIHAKTGGRCWYCGMPVSLDAANIQDRMCIDHQHPQCAGGDHDVQNLVPSCRTCNCKKGGKDIEEFRKLLIRQACGIPSFTKIQEEWLEAQGFCFPSVPDFAFWAERPKGEEQ